MTILLSRSQLLRVQVRLARKAAAVPACKPCRRGVNQSWEGPAWPSRIEERHLPPREGSRGPKAVFTAYRVWRGKEEPIGNFKIPLSGVPTVNESSSVTRMCSQGLGQEAQGCTDTRKRLGQASILFICILSEPH